MSFQNLNQTILKWTLAARGKFVAFELSIRAFWIDHSSFLSCADLAEVNSMIVNWS